MDGVFGEPGVFANPLLKDFLEPLLGGDMRLSGLTVVVSHPGAEMQHIHRDHPLLFQNLDESPELPTYALNVTVPLIDVAEETGPTGIWLGSHRWPTSTTPDPATMTLLPFERGDCVLIDYRTLHAGLPNRSNLVRPMAYMVYTRTWFYDEINHRMRPSLSMTLEQYEALPEAVQPLLMRAFSQHMRARYFSTPPA
jgi:ectoine hydroxylase-related dioxygenase (phytanoyl-CoA dioxygenase family)